MRVSLGDKDAALQGAFMQTSNVGPCATEQNMYTVCLSWDIYVHSSCFFLIFNCIMVTWKPTAPIQLCYRLFRYFQVVMSKPDQCAIILRRLLAASFTNYISSFTILLAIRFDQSISFRTGVVHEPISCSIYYGSFTPTIIVQNR
jgi:hypothetical protein